MLQFIQNPHLSLCKVSQQHNIDHKSVYKILKLIKFHLYKVKLVQELNNDNPDRCIEFCNLMMERTDTDPNFLFNIVFSNDAIFELNDQVNRHTTSNIIGVPIILTRCWKAILNIHKN